MGTRPDAIKSLVARAHPVFINRHWFWTSFGATKITSPVLIVSSWGVEAVKLWMAWLSIELIHLRGSCSDCTFSGLPNTFMIKYGAEKIKPKNIIIGQAEDVGGMASGPVWEAS